MILESLFWRTPDVEGVGGLAGDQGVKGSIYFRFVLYHTRLYQTNTHQRSMARERTKQQQQQQHASMVTTSQSEPKSK